ncbi:hypothetical protein R80B4_00511 [Fibrobacteres bacterium R8-0-B4]
MILKLQKLICAAIAILCVGAAGASAKVQPHALGLRFIGGTLLGGEINYQRAGGFFGSKRLEVGGSIWGGDNAYSIAVAVVPQWYWNISPKAANGGFNWYVGPGAAAGLYSKGEVKEERNNQGYITRRHEDGETRGSVYLGGQIGIEYDFNAVSVPLNISIDSRPMIDLLHSGGVTLMGIINGANLALRYTF